jgi:molybdenum cofactor biosynthesis enzyme MoaA
MPLLLQPLALERIADELPTGVWLDVLTQAAELGVLQLHLSGGERTVRRDLEDIVGLAAKVGLWHGADPSTGAELNVCAGTMPDTVRLSTRCRRSFP